MAKSESEIKDEISECTKTKKDAKAELDKYEIALDCAINLKKLLEKTCTTIEEISRDLGKYFIINGKIGDDGRTSKLYEGVNSSLNELKSLVIPEIEKKIKECNNKVVEMESKIRNLKNQL